MESLVATKILVLSDTHGLDFSSNMPTKPIDVAVHCGDLTDGSKLDEFRRAIQALNAINCPLKLVIAGNHDFTMDLTAFERKVAEASPPLEPELVAKEYGIPSEAQKLFEEATNSGIVMLNEGNHTFTLDNGALLTVFASPYTPSLGAWGFQYRPERGHKFDMAENVDIVVTHGPPRGILDYTHGRERAGCPCLFEAVARSKPQIHCFGHIHEGWGARQVKWRNEYGDDCNHFTAIDNDGSTTIEKLAGLAPTRFDSLEDLHEKMRKVETYEQSRHVYAGHLSRQTIGEQTLFINAAMADVEGNLSQLPWIVDIDLPLA